MIPRSSSAYRLHRFDEFQVYKGNTSNQKLRKTPRTAPASTDFPIYNSIYTEHIGNDGSLFMIGSTDNVVRSGIGGYGGGVSDGFGGGGGGVGTRREVRRMMRNRKRKRRLIPKGPQDLTRARSGTAPKTACHRGQGRRHGDMLLRKATLDPLPKKHFINLASLPLRDQGLVRPKVP